MFNKKEIQKAEDVEFVERVPAVDVFENGDGYLIKVDLPGVRHGDVDLTLDEGEMKLEARASSGWRYPVVYRRRFTVPRAIDREKVMASMTDGVLSLELPKAAAARETVIKVKAA